MNPKMLIRLGSQAALLFSVVKGVKRAHQDHDGLRYAESLLHAAAVVLTIAVVVREIRSPRTAGEVLAGGEGVTE